MSFEFTWNALHQNQNCTRILTEFETPQTQQVNALTIFHFISTSTKCESSAMGLKVGVRASRG
jgi:hypothetical protein